MNGIKEKGLKASKDKWRRIFLFTMVFVVTYFIIITAVAPSKYKLNVGDIAEVDIKAPRDIIDQEATKAKENEIIASVEKAYSLKSEVKVDADKNVITFFTKLINLKSDSLTEKEKIDVLKKIEAFKLSDANYKTLLSLSNEKSTELQWVLKSALDKVYENNIGEDESKDGESIKNTMTIQEAKAVADEVIEASEPDENIQNILKDMAYSQIKPNFIFDKSKTDEKITEELKKATKVYIKKNQIVVKEGEPITQKQVEILTELGLVGDEVDKEYLFTYAALAAFVALTLALPLDGRSSLL